MDRLDGSVQVWGHVRDDGTVRAYRSYDDAVAAGPVESLVVHDVDGWLYASTGRRFDPEEVIGVLSPACATIQTRDALTDIGIVEGVLSVTSHPLSGRMQTRLVLDKRLAHPRAWEPLREALRALPGAYSVELDADRPEYNYAFVTVLRRLRQ